MTSAAILAAFTSTMCLALAGLAAICDGTHREDQP